MSAGGADQNRCANLVVDHPTSCVSLDLLDVVLDELGARAAQQEVVELEAANEVTIDVDLVAHIAEVHTTAIPLPQAAVVLLRVDPQGGPDRIRQPTGAQLDAGKLGAINDRYPLARFG